MVVKNGVMRVFLTRYNDVTTFKQFDRTVPAATTRQPNSLIVSVPVSQTTIMAVEYDGGVVIGADSRTTTG